MKKETRREVKIQPACYAAIEKIVSHSQRFGSVDEYVNFVLAELLFGADHDRMTDDEQRGVEQRLKELGYLS